MCTINQEIDLEDLFKEFKKNDMEKSMIKNNEKFFKLSEKIHNTEWKHYQDFLVYLSKFQRKNKDFFRKSILGYAYKIWCKKNNTTPKQDIVKYLLKNSIRTGSGVTVITVFTSPKPTYENENGEKISDNFTCEWNCYYCPAEPAHEGNGFQKQVRSYVYDGPSTRRANENGFDPVRQFYSRAKTLIECGHEVDKIECIVLGGTWDSYNIKYRDWFCKMLYYSANMLYSDVFREPLSLQEEITINETADCHLIGLTIETRPDCITPERIRKLRTQGVTRVQLGVQHTDDNILRKINRKCYQVDTIRAIKLLKNACYKVDIHVMPDLCSSPEQDRMMMDIILYDSDYHADQIKLYPTYIVEWTVLKKWYDQGKFVPQDKDDLIENLIYFMSRVQTDRRMNRVGRDIPVKNKKGIQYIHGDTSHMNLKQIIDQKMKERGLKCRDIRSREAGWNEKDLDNIELVYTRKIASGGIEYFISMEDLKKDVIYGFLRLRITNEYTLPELTDCALIRELHVYGPVVKVNDINKKHSQHFGFGKKMLEYAENLAMSHNIKKIAIISGVGVRKYYEKNGYVLENTYMVKTLPYIKYKIKKFLYCVMIIFAIIFTSSLILFNFSILFNILKK